MLDLNELERKLDEALNNAIPESLHKYLEEKRSEHYNMNKKYLEFQLYLIKNNYQYFPYADLEGFQFEKENDDGYIEVNFNKDGVAIYVSDHENMYYDYNETLDIDFIFSILKEKEKEFNFN